LAKPVREISEDEERELTSAARKLTDGMSQMEFGISIGIYKKAKADKPGRKQGDGGRPPGPATPDEAKAAKLKMFRDDALAICDGLTHFKARFVIAEDEDMLILQGLLSRCELQARALHAWLDATPDKRDAALVQKIQAMFAQ
jgi:hypothetical protein